MSNIIELDELLEQIEDANKKILELRKDEVTLKQEITEIFNKIDNSETLLNSIKSKSSKLENFEDLAKKLEEDKSEIRKIGSEYLVKIEGLLKALNDVVKTNKESLKNERLKNIKYIFIASFLGIFGIVAVSAWGLNFTKVVKKNEMLIMLQGINSNFERVSNRILELEKNN